MAPDPQKSRRLVGVVVTHNRLEKLQVTLARLLGEPPEVLAAVVVVDNACTDGTRAWLETLQDPRLDVQHSAQNIGGAGGFERGMRHAMATHAPDWLVLMDDDARPEAGALARFHERAVPETEACAAAVYFPDGRICEMNRPSVNPFWSFRAFFRTCVKGRDGYHIPYTTYDADGPCQIDLTSFVGFFLPAKVVQEVGYPDPGLFLYGDDVIYTLGLRRRGVGIRFDPDIRFEHDCTTYSQSRSRRVFRPLWKVYYFYRNGLIMYRTAAGPAFWFVLPLLLVKWRRTASCYGKDQDRYRRLMSRAVQDALRGQTARSHVEVLSMAEPTLRDSE